MNKILKLDKTAFNNLIDTTKVQIGINESLIEKDF